MMFAHLCSNKLNNYFSIIMHTSFACVWGLCICVCLFVSVWAHVCLCKWMGANAYGSLGVMLAIFLSDSPSHSLRQGVIEASAHEYKLCTVTILLCGFPGLPDLHTGTSRVSLFGFKLVLTPRPRTHTWMIRVLFTDTPPLLPVCKSLLIELFMFDFV